MTGQRRNRLSASDCESIRNAPVPAIAVCAGDEGATARMTRRLAAATRSLVPERGGLPMLEVFAVDRPLLSGATDEELECDYSEVSLYYDVVLVDAGAVLALGGREELEDLLSSFLAAGSVTVYVADPEPAEPGGFSGPAFAAGAVEIPKERNWDHSPGWEAILAGEWPPEARRLEGSPAVFARDLYQRALVAAQPPDGAVDDEEPL